MIAPLLDVHGNLKYFIGAQVDVSGLVKDSVELDGLRRLVEGDVRGANRPLIAKMNSKLSVRC